MLSRRQLQGFVIPLRIVAGFQLRSPERGSAALFKSFKSRSTRPAPRRAFYQTLKSRTAFAGFQNATRDNAGLQRRGANRCKSARRKHHEEDAVAASAASHCSVRRISNVAVLISLQLVMDHLLDKHVERALLYL